MANDNHLCPICKSNAQLRYLESSLRRYDCPRCGTFDIDRIFEAYSSSGQLWAENIHLVSAWIRRQNKAGISPNLAKSFENGAESWGQSLRNAGFPETIDEKFNALLLAYAETTGDDYTKTLDPTLPYLVADIAAKNQEEVLGLTILLVELGFIIQARPASPRRISAKGWQRIDELRRVVTSSNSAFVAMWFNEVTELYRDSVIAAIQYCGYKAVIVDQEEYNGFIMDQVTSLIRQSRFVVADFTCRPEEINNGIVRAGVRGGVYWEAGMAYGQGKPVIHTCEDNDESKKRRHFDIDQYNTIFWKPEELSTNIRELSDSVDNPNFAEKLSARIIATVGRCS